MYTNASGGRGAFLCPLQSSLRPVKRFLRANYRVSVSGSKLSWHLTQCPEVSSIISYIKPFLTMSIIMGRQVVDREFTAVRYRTSDRSGKCM